MSLATSFKSATSSWPDKGNMPWDRKRLLGYVETIQLISGVTENFLTHHSASVQAFFLCAKKNRLTKTDLLSTHKNIFWLKNISVLITHYAKWMTGSIHWLRWFKTITHISAIQFIFSCVYTLSTNGQNGTSVVTSTSVTLVMLFTTGWSVYSFFMSSLWLLYCTCN